MNVTITPGAASAFLKPNRSQRVALVVAGAALGMLAGCASPTRSGDYYSRNEVLRELTVRMAVVESVRDVVIDRDSRGVGTLAGAAIGGVAGSGVGQGKGAAVGSIGGAVIGGVIGQAIEGSNTRVPALEITVRLPDGALVAIVQEPGAVRPKAGDSVRLLTGRDGTRVVPV